MPSLQISVAFYDLFGALHEHKRDPGKHDEKHDSEKDDDGHVACLPRATACKLRGGDDFSA